MFIHRVKRYCVQLKSLVVKVCRRLRRLFLQPIPIYCLHQVSDVYNPETCYECDWLSLKDFKKTIQQLKASYSFIPLSEAYRKLKHEKVRFRKYAVLTFDDGYKSSMDALIWLESQEIYYTLFLNAKYLDGKSMSEHIYSRAQSISPQASIYNLVSGLYLTKKDVSSLSQRWCSIGSHGLEHNDATSIGVVEFENQLMSCKSYLSGYSTYIPFHAYTWGHHSPEIDTVVMSLGMIPVLMDGQKNYRFDAAIHRELFPQ